MKRQKKYISRISKSLLLMVLSVNFIYAGVFSTGQMEMGNCCHNIVEEKSCCAVEPEVFANPSCHMEMKVPSESMRNCGCIHDNPISESYVLIKDNVELPKNFGVTINFINDETTNKFSFSINESVKINQSSSPIYIINSSFLI